MAKKTKDSNLSIEERLEQALIPNWDEPYKLPPNWCWVNLGSLGTLGMGQTILSKDLKEEGVPVYSATEEDKIFGYISESENTIKLSSGDIVIPARGNSIGHVKYISCDEASCTQTTMFFKPFDKSIGKYVYYYMQGNKHKLFAYHGNAIPQITITNITKKEIPIPPLNEQQRIVERIESLLAKLDEAKEKAQEVVDGFETRKAAILHKAFSGELTVKWREKNGVSFGDWHTKLFDECIEKMQNGLAKRKGSAGVPYVVLRLANLSDDGFITDDLREIVLDEKEQKSYKLNIGDVVMVRVNGSKDNVAKQILVTENNLWAFCDHIIRIKYNEYVLPEYMVLYSKSEAYKVYVKDNIVSSAGQNTISRKGMARLSIPVPSIEEQKEIIDILSNMFDKERRVKETAETVIYQIDTMKKAILARAFRGELGTNDPSEESALELLKSVLNNSESSEKVPEKKNKKISIPPEIKKMLSNAREEEIIKLLLKTDSETIPMQTIMALSSKKFELMDSLRNLEKKQVITKNESGEYSLKR